MALAPLPTPQPVPCPAADLLETLKKALLEPLLIAKIYRPPDQQLRCL